MAEILGAIQRALGWALNAIYDVVPSYGLAIVLLTLAVRAVLIPLTVKQIRSMRAMQAMQPELKKVQAKYKQLQQKANDRTEVQQLRLQMNQEMQSLFKEHGASPYSGCLPILAQMPVFIAMFSVMRAAIIVVPTTISLVGGTGGAPPRDLYTEDQLKKTICRPVSTPRPEGSSPSRIRCETPGQEPKTFEVEGFVEPKAGDRPRPNAGWIATCRPAQGEGGLTFNCHSALGSGHLPEGSELFKDVTLSRADVFGMHPGCTAPQAASPERIQECTALTSNGEGGFGTALPYYLLIALIIGTQYYQAKQMAARATGPAAQQQQMMMRIMPIFIGLVSLSIPAGANVYFLASNVWQIGQQHLLFKKQDEVIGEEQQAAVPPVKQKQSSKSQSKVAPAAQRTGSPERPSSNKKKGKKRKKR